MDHSRGIQLVSGGEFDELAHQLFHAFDALGWIIPGLPEYHALVGPDRGAIALAADEADESLGFGKAIFMQTDDRALRSGFHPFDIGRQAQALDRDHLEQVLHFPWK